MRRETVRRLDLYLPHLAISEGRETIRPDRLIERLVERSAGEPVPHWGAREIPGYTVEVWGPVLTKSGKPHANGRETYVLYGRENMAELPEEIRVQLVGPQVMKGELA